MSNHTIFYLQNDGEQFSFHVADKDNLQKPLKLDYLLQNPSVKKNARKIYLQMIELGEADPDYAIVHISSTKSLMRFLNRCSTFLVCTNLELQFLPKEAIPIQFPLNYMIDNDKTYLVFNGKRHQVFQSNIAFMEGKIHILTNDMLFVTPKNNDNKKLYELLTDYQIEPNMLSKEAQKKGLENKFNATAPIAAEMYTKTLFYEKKSFKLLANAQFGLRDTKITWNNSSAITILEYEDQKYIRDTLLENAMLKDLRLNGFYEINGSWVFNGRFPENNLKKLEELGWKILAGYEKPSETTPSLQFIKGVISFNISCKTNWFDLDGIVTFDKEVIPLKELIDCTRKNAPIKLKDNNQGVLPVSELQKLEFFLPHIEMQENDFTIPYQKMGVISKALELNMHIQTDETTKILAEQLSDFKKIEPQNTPEEFKLSLRDYQKDGLAWLVFLNKIKSGGILADDMGLGKTAQILAFIQWLNNNHGKTRVLVVVPKSLLFNWKAEIEKFTPQLKSFVYHGSNRKREELQSDDSILITTYHTLRNNHEDFKEINYDLIILDESQAIKNHTTAVYKAVKSLNATQKICMTGTPIENHLGELWSQFHFLMPGLLKSYNNFRNYYINNPLKPVLEQLKSFIYPFILRRKKEDVAKELPPKIEQVIYCEMHPSQQAYYNQLKDSVRNEIFSIVSDNTLKKSKLHILEGLLRLRQAACHPELISKKKNLYTSGKLDSLIAMVSEVIGEGHKVLIFSQFTSMLALIETELKKQSLQYFYLDGSTNNRQEIVDDFQNSKSAAAFLISLKAGGVGLNLTAAEYVFIFDPWWNPAVENQAIDRAYRIGQSKSVFAYRMITKDTIEEKILKLQLAKKNLAEDILNNEKSLIQSLSREDLQFLLS